MAYLKPLGFVTVIMMLIIWAFMAMYWGSLWKENERSPNLRVLVMDYDGGEIGSSIVDALKQANSAPLPHPTYVFAQTNEYPNDDAVTNAIEPLQEYWGAVTIMQDATRKLQAARSSGDNSWNPTSVITIMTSTARNYAVVPSIVLSPTQRFLQSATAKLNAQLLHEFLSASVNDANAINTALRAPQTLSGPVGIRMNELRPWDHSVAIAPTFVGLIYLVILTFQITMASFGARQPIQKFLRLRSVIAMRLVTPIVGYIPISLMFSLLNVPFKLPYGRTFPYGGGFMTWWCVSYIGMLVMGLVLESVMTMVGLKFIGVFLIFFIISNVSVSNLPIELSPSFFKYGYAMPFYQLRSIYITVLFNTGKRTLLQLTFRHLDSQVHWYPVGLACIGLPDLPRCDLVRPQQAPQGAREAGRCAALRGSAQFPVASSQASGSCLVSVRDATRLLHAPSKRCGTRALCRSNDCS